MLEWICDMGPADCSLGIRRRCVFPRGVGEGGSGGWLIRNTEELGGGCSLRVVGIGGFGSCEGSNDADPPHVNSPVCSESVTIMPMAPILISVSLPDTPACHTCGMSWKWLRFKVHRG